MHLYYSQRWSLRYASQLCPSTYWRAPKLGASCGIPMASSGHWASNRQNLNSLTPTSKLVFHLQPVDCCLIFGFLQPCFRSLDIIIKVTWVDDLVQASAFFTIGCSWSFNQSRLELFWLNDRYSLASGMDCRMICSQIRLFNTAKVNVPPGTDYQVLDASRNGNYQVHVWLY